jgi:hypothetical protein
LQTPYKNGRYRQNQLRKCAKTADYSLVRIYEKLLKKHELKTDKKAIKNEEFLVYNQPQMTLKQCK